MIAALAVTVGALIVWIAGRGMYRNYGISSAAVEQFHQELDRGDYDAIWENATDGFRASGTHADEIKVFETVHQTMGVSGKTSSLGFHVNWQSNRVYVSHVFDTAFANGHGQESLVWVVEQGKPRLQTYHIESPLLK